MPAILSFGIYLLFGILLFGIFPPLAPAQTPPQLVVFADSTPIIVAAPPPFIEVSRNLPDAFAQRSRALTGSGRLLAWFIPAQALKENLLDATPTPPRCRALQVQVMKEMEPLRYDARTFQKLRDETLLGCAVPQITLDDAGTLFRILDLTQVTQQPGGQKILGAADLGRDSFTLCVATSAEATDRMGGRAIETSITCVTYVLIKEKILLLTVTAPDLTPNELRTTLRLTAEWLLILRTQNPK